MKTKTERSRISLSALCPVVGFCISSRVPQEEAFLMMAAEPDDSSWKSSSSLGNGPSCLGFSVRLFWAITPLDETHSGPWRCHLVVRDVSLGLCLLLLGDSI